MYATQSDASFGPPLQQTLGCAAAGLHAGAVPATLAGSTVRSSPAFEPMLIPLPPQAVRIARGRNRPASAAGREKRALAIMKSLLWSRKSKTEEATPVASGH